MSSLQSPVDRELIELFSLRSKLGLDLVPRTGPLAVSPTQIGIVALHNVHMTSDETAKNTSVSESCLLIELSLNSCKSFQSRGTLRRKAQKKILTHHLYLCMRDFGYRIGDDAEVYFYLYDGHPSRQRQITERFLVKISKDNFSTYVEMPHSNCTVFTDLGE